ncbi:SUMF1/EgtB/PvdO family nonheme iron enzyme [Aerosakkonema sp. BLCC-F183]|uniref:SUMF1/EgtB/PvdO family nonheme iron enzyme n=1 Tax=Aerosakkonema sp. BLCC-F183 TaxID=3342834 RepID=UPI0035B799B7
MISKSIPSELSQFSTADERRQEIKEAMQLCRAGTLALFEDIDRTTFSQQPHPEFSPIGWHLGHIGYAEALWLLEHCAKSQLPPLTKEGKSIPYRRLLAADGLPKHERVNLPSLSEICVYLDTVRKEVFDYLEIAPLDEQERLWRFLIQHESQHSEIIFFLLQLQRWSSVNLQSLKTQFSETQQITDNGQLTETIEIPAGEFEMGNDTIDALDNERPCHRVYLDTYQIDRYPVTCGQYRLFMEAGGYQNSQWWTPAGWEWLQANQFTQPLYWREDSAWDDRPVCGVSWYEADAFARFVGKRLPTEAEWEKAASWDAAANRRRTYPWGEEKPNAHLCNHDWIKQKQQPNSAIQNPATPVNAYPAGQSAYGLYDTLGNVWEWTSTWFDGYEGFEYYPYRGYSQAYFDRQHRVLKGGSWATRPWALRCSFRNWYLPGVRQILAGFRCAIGRV